MSSDKRDRQNASKLDGQLLSDLWIFQAAASTGSITAAAERLHVTQGSISQRVLRLEARLGTSLFVRQRSRISLSEAGTDLAEAMSVVATVLNDALSRINHEERGALVVSCPPSFAAEWLVPRLNDFYRQCPNVELSVRAELLPSTADRMDADGIDLCVDYSPHPEAGLCELASHEEMLFPVCSAAYRRHVDDPGNLSTEVVLLHDDVPWMGGTPQDEWQSWRRGAGMNWPIGRCAERHFNLAHLAYHAAVCGQGIAIGRSLVVNRLLARGDLVPAFASTPVKGAHYRILTHRPGNRQSPARQFADWWKKSVIETQEHTLALVGESGHANEVYSNADLP